MQLILKARHIEHASIRTYDFNLKFKLKTAIKIQQPEPDDDILLEVSSQEIISTYNSISALPKEKYEVINNEMKSAFMSQLMDESNKPVNEEAGQVVSWILQFRNEMQSELNIELENELSNLKS